MDGQSGDAEGQHRRAFPVDNALEVAISARENIRRFQIWVREERRALLGEHGYEGAQLPVRISDSVGWSVRIHRQLEMQGYARCFVPGTEHIGNELLPEWVVFDCGTTFNGGTIPIIIFPRLLNKTCSVCLGGPEEIRPLDRNFWPTHFPFINDKWVWQSLGFPTATFLPECHHKFNVCRKCIGAHISADIRNRGVGAVNNIECPSGGCRHRFTFDEIRRFASPIAFDAYDKHCLNYALQAMPDFMWCTGYRCKSGGFYDNSPGSTACPDKLHRVVCRDCNAAMCTQCKTPWHAGRTCAEFQELLQKGDPRNERWIATNAKRCPNPNCRVPTVKDVGCNHMICAYCRHAWCWGCGAPWNSDGSSHIESCDLFFAWGPP
ncbi:hypothetical protein GGR51DRAFT_561278 [Nemania sp. FL0031]|nr:hypothetical protein GGR51DRAFT_561278 [Nemania sp. FL0031]